MLARHYERVIAACGFLFVFVNVGLASTAFSVHQPYIVAMPGIGDTGGSLILSMRTLVSLLAMLLVDRYYRLLDVRLGVTAASLMVAAGFVLYSFAGSLPAFLAGAVFLGLGYGLGGMVAMTFLANRWFASGIGSVIGVVSMGSGVASIAMPLVVVRVIEAFSLAAAFRVEAAVSAVLGIVVFALLRNRPSDLGMEPYAGKPGKERTRQAPQLLPAPRAERVALHGAMVLVGVFSCCGMTYLSVLATSSGFDPVFAATLVSTAGVALTCAKFATGELFDHIGTPRATAVMFGCGLAGYALCCLAGMQSAPLMLAGAVLVGMGLSLGTVGISMWSLQLSEPESRAREIKNFQVCYALGGFIANTLPGIVKDLVGTYVASYAGVFFLTALAAFVILRFYRVYTR